MKRLSEYKARVQMDNAPKNPTREDIMKVKPLNCTAENPEPALMPTPDSRDSPAGTGVDSKAEMDRVFVHYLESLNRPVVPGVKPKRPELEIRFQGTGGAPLTKIDYDNVIQHLYAAGFTTPNPDGAHILRVIPNYIDQKKGIEKMSNIRAEISGVDLIQEYCKTNSIQHLLNLPSSVSAGYNKITFTRKMGVPKNPLQQRGETFRAVDNHDFQFRVGYQQEDEFGPYSEMVRDMIDTKRWADSKKIFRHLNRVRFSHPTLPIFADVSILRTSAKSGKHMVPQYTIQDAKVFQQTESYEIELEIDNTRVGKLTEYDTPAKLLADVRKTIRVVLSAIQGTNYPVGETEMRRVIHLYQRLLHGDKYDPESEKASCSFIGPSSRTLQMENIAEPPPVEIGFKPNLSLPNIRYNYTVTDKADGERKMLLIDDSGKLYFIDMNMRVQFTGTMTAEKKLHFSLFDGEHIKYDKSGKFINLYAVFDVYYVSKTSARDLPFMPIIDEISELKRANNDEREEEQQKPKSYRWRIMNRTINEWLKPFSILDKNKPRKTDTDAPDPNSSTPCSLRVQCKDFYVGSVGTDIFYKCSLLLSKMRDGLFEYNTDGLIFTPAEYGVGGGPETVSGPLYKHTWDRSFKWKPAEFNTIDFLVRLKKDENGRDVVGADYGEGVQFDREFSVKQYKTVVLHCGFDVGRHGYMNPFQQLIDGDFAKREAPVNEEEEVRPESTYGASPFMPTSPADPKACLCNVLMTEDQTGKTYLRTEEGEYFEENMIVEFRYDMSRKGAWRWVPLRVRYDKTAQMSSLCGGKRAFYRKKQSFGNDFDTANNNWFSIHNPITEKMLSGTEDIPKSEAVGEDVYYNRRTTQTTTRGLRDFHNLYVKMRLINGTTNRKDTLIDFAVGKAGDLSKWRAAKLGFVFGVDVSRDNIMNRIDGACSRYLTEASKYSGMFDALFLHGNSAQNIRSGEAFEGYKEKMIAKAVFGEGAKVRAELGDAVYRAYGIGHEGFHVSSCQFALHYFFENVRTMHNFVRNVAECTRVGGVFVGTCWDGKTVFNMLRNKSCGDSYTISRYGTRVFQITKMYDYTAFPDDELSLGYSVSVFQESIGQHIVEYLVNFDFFRRVMENYGFVLMNREEATQFGFPNGGTGMFEGLYYDMKSELKRDPSSKYGTAPEMTEDEKTISFLNRYFIFRKVRHVAAERITKVIESSMPFVEASSCKTAVARVAPVSYDSSPESARAASLEEGEEPEESVERITQNFSKREEIAARMAATTLATQSDFMKPPPPPPANEKTTGRPVHFIRPLAEHKITIRGYDPIEESESLSASSAAASDTAKNTSAVALSDSDLPISTEEPAIRLVPNKGTLPGKSRGTLKPK